MGFTDLNRDNFRSTVGPGGIVMVLCRAPNCGACRAMEPGWRAVAARHPGHTFAHLDVLAEEDLATFFEIGHTPTLMVYRDGLLLLRKAASYSEEELEGIVRQVEALDMDLVRAGLEAEEGTNDDGSGAGQGRVAGSGAQGPRADNPQQETDR